MKQRDIDLDNYRIFIMIYIVCVVHTLCWLNLASDWVISIILFEMPVIFFIAGASASLANYSSKTWKEIFISRFKRVMIPYYLYLIISVIILYLFHYFRPDSNVLNITFFNSIVDTVPKNIPFGSHLWFIIVYFLLSLTIKIQILFLKALKPFFYLLINILVIAILDFSMSDFEEFRPFIIFKEIIVYNVFYISGYCFYINKKTFKELFLILIVSLILLCVFCWEKFPLIQEEKFPPTSIFLFYGIVMLSILSIIFRIVKIRDVKLPKIWNHGGFTIYLYQNYAFWFYTVGSSFLLKLVPEYLYFYHSFIFSALVIFILSSILGYLFYPIECKVIKMFSRKQNNEK